jgi:cephalosporin hydroxylase/glycosyltransferase involved in cell wall biosynthesis
MNQTSSTEAETLEGWIDSHDQGVIRGWAWYPSRPEVAVTVEVVVDDHVATVAIARTHRSDLSAAGKRGGDCGFTIPLTFEDAGVDRKLRIIVRAKDGPTLSGGDFTLALVTQLTHLPVAFSGQPGLTGCFDQFGPDVVSGWVSRAANPSPPPDIEIWEAGEKVFSFAANIWRTDLEEVRQGDGRWGFAAAIPDSLRDGEVHTLEVSFGDSRQSITSHALRLKFPKLPQIPEIRYVRDGDEDRSTRVRPQRRDIPADVVFTFIVNFYNMPREAARTLRSLTRAYQQGIGTIAYEVLCIDNGSSPPLERDWIEAFGPEFRVIRPTVLSPSPCAAINEAARQAKGRYVAIMIDGAHILTPGVFREVWDAIDDAPEAVVALRQWFVGGDQRWLSVSGYTREQEDILFDKIAWPSDGYKLFRIGTPIWESPNHWLDGMIESNCLFVPRSIYDRIGGMDENFSEPGAGYANLDLFKRAVTESPEPVIAILGEASFHQFHDGTTTNVSDSEKERRVRTYENNYMRLRGEAYAGIAPVDIRQRGQLRAQAAVVGRQRPLSPAHIGVTDQVRQGSLPLHFDDMSAANLQSVYVECGLHKLTKWLGHEILLAPADIAEIQDIIFRVRPDRIVAVNVNFGVVVLLTSLLQMCGLTQSHVVYVCDTYPTDENLPATVDLVVGEPCTAETVSRVRGAVGSEEGVMVLFSPQRHDYIPVEPLRIYGDLVSSRSYFIFLGTVFGQPWLGYSKYWFQRAIKTMVAESGFVIDHSRNQQLVTTCPNGYLQKISADGWESQGDTASFDDI